MSALKRSKIYHSTNMVQFQMLWLKNFASVLSFYVALAEYTSK